MLVAGRFPSAAKVGSKQTKRKGMAIPLLSYFDTIGKCPKSLQKLHNFAEENQERRCKRTLSNPLTTKSMAKEVT